MRLTLHIFVGSQENLSSEYLKEDTEAQSKMPLPAKILSGPGQKTDETVDVASLNDDLYNAKSASAAGQKSGTEGLDMTWERPESVEEPASPLDNSNSRIAKGSPPVPLPSNEEDSWLFFLLPFSGILVLPIGAGLLMYWKAKYGSPRDPNYTAVHLGGAQEIPNKKRMS